MEWLNPAGAWALLGLAAVIALWMLKKKANRVPVPSLMLWQRMRAETRQSRPIERLRSRLLFWLQILMVLLLTLALMRPTTVGESQGEAVFIFDLSASMQAADENGLTRLERARAEALELLDGMREGEAVTILAAGHDFEQILSRAADHAQVRRAIEPLEAGNGTADLAGALALADALKRDIDGLRVYVFSDDASLRVTGAQLLNAGVPVENRALLDASMQPESETAFARVKNYGAACEAELECYADGVLCDVRTVSLEENAEAGVRFSIPSTAQSITVRLTQEDALSADNVRYAVRAQSSERTALLVTESNVFLQRALALVEGLTVDVAAPEDAGQTGDYDLYIYDGCLPDTLPDSGAIWAINPPSAVLDITPIPMEDGQLTLRSAANQTANSLCENLPLSDIAVKEAQALTGGTPVLTAAGNTLLAVEETQERLIAVLGFDLHNSNLPLKADFPVLVQNLTAYLLPEAAASVERASCGKAVTLHTDVRAQSAYVLTPSGRKAALNGSLLEDTDEIGVYTLVEELGGEETRRTSFALHIPMSESDTLSVAESTEALLGEASTGWHEWTVYLLLALFLVTIIEWEVSRRGA